MLPKNGLKYFYLHPIIVGKCGLCKDEEFNQHNANDGNPTLGTTTLLTGQFPLIVVEVCRMLSAARATRTSTTRELQTSYESSRATCAVNCPCKEEWRADGMQDVKDCLSCGILVSGQVWGQKKGSVRWKNILYKKEHYPPIHISNLLPDILHTQNRINAFKKNLFNPKRSEKNSNVICEIRIIICTDYNIYKNIT